MGSVAVAQALFPSKPVRPAERQTEMQAPRGSSAIVIEPVSAHELYCFLQAQGRYEGSAHEPGSQGQKGGAVNITRDERKRQYCYARKPTERDIRDSKSHTGVFSQIEQCPLCETRSSRLRGVAVWIPKQDPGTGPEGASPDLVKLLSATQ